MRRARLEVKVNVSARRKLIRENTDDENHADKSAPGTNEIVIIKTEPEPDKPTDKIPPKIIVEKEKEVEVNENNNISNNEKTNSPVKIVSQKVITPPLEPAVVGIKRKIELNKADSVVNNPPPIATTTSPEVPTSPSKSKKKRRVVVSESARKLAEARKEFQNKHVKSLPDRTKLTMYDFIYYNPAGNPMETKSKGSQNARPLHSGIDSRMSQERDEDREAEEADDPDEDEDGDGVPAPQVKVGPNGELIIDEQSLVIEGTGVKKNREALARQEVVINDEENLGSGFYKKRKKTKDWSTWETIKFYKALSTIGIDFLLMQTFFPSRSRHELKLKYKKEERKNKSLIDKALSYNKDMPMNECNDLESFKRFITEVDADECNTTSPPKCKPQKTVKTGNDESNNKSSPDDKNSKKGKTLKKPGRKPKNKEPTDKPEPKKAVKRRGAKESVKKTRKSSKAEVLKELKELDNQEAVSDQVPAKKRRVLRRRTVTDQSVSSEDNNLNAESHQENTLTSSSEATTLILEPNDSDQNISTEKDASTSNEDPSQPVEASEGEVEEEEEDGDGDAEEEQQSQSDDRIELYEDDCVC